MFKKKEVEENLEFALIDRRVATVKLKVKNLKHLGICAGGTKKPSAGASKKDRPIGRPFC